MLHCGSAKACINPELPVILVGYDVIPATGIHDDLHVTALYLDDGHEKLAVLTYDTMTTNSEFVAAVQEACGSATGINPEKILLTVSHCHSTPSVRKSRSVGKLGDGVYKEGYQDFVVKRSVEALQEAVGRAEPVTVHYNSTRVQENINRRVFFPGGTHYYQPKQKNLTGLSDGYVDEELLVIFFRKAGGREILTTLVNYTAHPLTIGDSSTLISADYPGVLKREIEANLGGTAHFINGACGDNHPKGAEGGLARCERMGLELAEKALYHRWDAVPVDIAPIGCSTHEILLPPMTEDDFKRLPPNFSEERRSIREEYLVDGSIKTSFNIWAIGPLAFVGVPGEVSAELGVRLKWESPFPKTFVMYLSTDHIGYISHPNAYQWGGYEVATSPFGPDAGATLIGEAVQKAGDLKARLEERAGERLNFPDQRINQTIPNSAGAK